MARPTEIAVTSRTAAKLFEIKEPEFLRLVDEGVLPRARMVGGFRRWSRAELEKVVSGEAMEDAFEV